MAIVLIFNALQIQGILNWGLFWCTNLAIKFNMIIALFC